MPTALLCGLVAVLSVICASNLIAQEPEVGSVKRQYRTQVMQTIPFHQLNQTTKDKLNSVLNKPSIYRRLPISTINSDPDYFRFLVRYPEVLVDIWQLMGVTKMSTQRTGPYTINCDDGAGTLSTMELVYGNDNLHIFYGTGSYEGPVLRKKLYGSCVLVLQTGYAQGADGKPIATNQLDVFLKVENAALGLIAKTIQPIVGTTADHNFVESLKFVQRLNETTERNGPGVQRMAKRLDISQEVRQKFVDVVSLVFERSSAGAAPAYMGSITPGGVSAQPAGQQAIHGRALGNNMSVGSPYGTVSPSGLRTGVPFSSFDQLVPVVSHPASVAPAGNHHGAANLGRYPVQDTQHSGGPAAAYHAASRSMTARPYGYQAPGYTPVYQGEGVNHAPIAYQADAFGTPGYSFAAKMAASTIESYAANLVDSVIRRDDAERLNSGVQLAGNRFQRPATIGDDLEPMPLRLFGCRLDRACLRKRVDRSR